MLAGVRTHHRSLTQLLPNQQAIRPNDAAAMVLAGLTLVGVARRWNRWVPGSAAFSMFVIGAATQVEYLVGTTWAGLDGLLAPLGGRPGDALPTDRMGANVAFDFTLLGIAGMLLLAGRAPNARQTFAAAVMGVAIVALFGYMLGVPALSGHGLAGIGMALGSAVMQLLLGFGFLVARGDRGWATVFTSPFVGGRIARGWVPLSILVISLILVLTQRQALPWFSDLTEQLGISAVVMAVATAALVLAVSTDRLDQDRVRQATAAVDRSERRYRLGFEGSPVGIAAVDGSGTFLEVNKALSDMTGMSAEALVGRESIASISRADQAPSNVAIKDRMSAGLQRVASFETAIVHASGRHVPVKIDAVRVEADVAASQTLMFGFVTDLSAITEKNQQLALLAEKDPLTSVLNRRGFLDHVKAALDAGGGPSGADACRTGGGSCAVLFIDIDAFKLVNDVYGHRVGDRFLCAVAERLVEDTAAYQGQVGRLGGDEFAVLLADCPPQRVPGIAADLQRSISEPVIVEGVTLSVSCSIGHAVAEGAGLNPEDLMARADSDMYATRRAARDGLAEQVERLRAALDDEQLHVHYQPIWRLGPDGPGLHGYESLLRWQHPDQGMIPPGEFIPTAEAGGLIYRLDMWAAATALHRFAAQPAIGLALNCSALTLAVPGMAHELLAAITASGRDPRSVIVELTESVEIPDNSQIMKSLNDLRHAGVTIALDDFGAGYAGLNNLRTLPIDIVKIDRTLVETLATDSSQAQNTEHFLTGIRQLTHAMGTQLLAEGIENPRQLSLIHQIGFDYVQGFLLGAPSPDGGGLRPGVTWSPLL